MRPAALVLALFNSAIVAAQTHPDLILHDAYVWTVNRAQPRAEAVAIQGNRIQAVGSNESILAMRGPDTRLLDLHGRMLLPGFNDNHVHFASAARFLEFNIMNVTTQQEFVARVEDVIGRLPAGEWITGGYWGAYDEWAQGSAGGESREPFTPDVRRIDEASAAYPLFIQKFDGSEYLINSAAIHALGLDIEPGIISDPERARSIAERVPQELSHERRLEQTRHALRIAREAGVTNVSDMSDDEQLAIYRELRDAGELTLRIHFRYPLDRWRELARRDIQIGSGDPWIRLGSLKGHIDGIMGNSTARFFEPYSHDSDNRGRWRRLMVDESGAFVEGQFLQYMLDADNAGLQLTVHAIGDEANHLLLDYLEVLNEQNGRKDRRFRLVHAQVIAPEDFERLGELGVVAEVQPYHLADDMRWMEERIGYERCRGAYAFKSIQESGATLCFGTDWPGTSAAEYPINPMYGLYAAVTRKTLTGEPEEGWFPGERISMEDAIKAYTRNTAYANFEEHIKGTINTGKLADLVVLSKNLLTTPPENTLNTRIIYTIVDGKFVHADPELGAREVKPFLREPFTFGTHRGGAFWRPESTIKTYIEGAETFPIAMQEVDVRMTADGEVVVLHDETVDRISDGSGPIAGLTLAEAQSLDAAHGFSPDNGATHPYRGMGYRIPTFRDVLRALPDHRFLVELKPQPGIADAALDVIFEEQADDRVLLASFDPALMQRAKRLAPHIARCFTTESRAALVEALRSDEWASYIPDDDVFVFNYDRMDSYGITPDDIPALHAKNIPLLAYTLNTEERINEALDMGVDGLLTDRPDILAATLQERERLNPAPRE